MTKVIYKVRMLDMVGKEVAEFGFYEDSLDAERRRAEVASMTMMPGILDITSVELTLAKVKPVHEERSKKDYYDFK
jgi:hypothetical protein